MQFKPSIVFSKNDVVTKRMTMGVENDCFD